MSRIIWTVAWWLENKMCLIIWVSFNQWKKLWLLSKCLFPAPWEEAPLCCPEVSSCACSRSLHHCRCVKEIWMDCLCARGWWCAWYVLCPCSKEELCCKGISVSRHGIKTPVWLGACAQSPSTVFPELCCLGWLSWSRAQELHGPGMCFTSSLQCFRLCGRVWFCLRISILGQMNCTAAGFRLV